MKVILSGSTGFIGGEVLAQALANSSISSVVCLTRRGLPEDISTNSKVKVILLSDFTSYPPEVLSQLEGAEACIWALGTSIHKIPSVEESKKIHIEYTLAAGKAFAASLAPQLKTKGKTFRFVYVSGMLANRETSKRPWFMPDSRNIKGEAENGLLALQEEEGSNLEVSIVRPGGVLPRGSMMPNILVGPMMHIRIEELAAAVVDEALSDAKGSRTFESNDLRSRGRTLLNKGNRDVVG